MMRVDTKAFSAEVLESAVPVLADFYSDSCLPCKRLSAVLAKIEAEYGNRLKIVKINVKYEQNLAIQYRVTLTPTLLFFRQGEVTARLDGAITKESIEEQLEVLL